LPLLGDNQKAVSAAQISNFPTISIAAGGFSAPNLSSFNPDLVIQNLVDDTEIHWEFIKVFPQ
jgi:hypothetical protein